MQRGAFRARTRPANDSGWVAEWFKAPVLKTGVGASPPWVRIPPHPPTCFAPAPAQTKMTCRNYPEALLALWIAGCAGPAVGHDEAVARTAFRAAEVALDRHSDGFFLDDDPQAPALLERRWSVVRQWTVAYLKEHPAATEAEIASAVRRLSADLRIEAIRLDPRTVLVSASRGEMGTVFIVAAPGKRFAIAWTISHSAASSAPEAGLLAAWAADGARDSCRMAPPNRGGCGPLFGAIGRLPDDGAGNHRFYVDATYAQPMGLTVAVQLSIWTWTGRTAKPLFAKTYAYMLDQRLGTRLDGNLLHLRVKDEFKTFFACGSCEGRQLDWTIRIGPDRIEDLGKTSAVPELDLIDALYDRMLNGEPVKDLASPAVVKALASKTAAVGRKRQRRAVLPCWACSWIGKLRPKVSGQSCGFQPTPGEPTSSRSVPQKANRAFPPPRTSATPSERDRSPQAPDPSAILQSHQAGTRAGKSATSESAAGRRAIRCRRRETMLKEFKEFAMRGNLIDMAVGIIMGVAFGGLVNSLVNDVIMPIVGKITGGVDFSNLFINLSGPHDQFASLKAAKDAGAATVNYGLFINLIINFVIVAFVMFLLIKGMNKMKKEAPATIPAAPPRSEVLLAEIRDLLKK